MKNTINSLFFASLALFLGFAPLYAEGIPESDDSALTSENLLVDTVTINNRRVFEIKMEKAVLQRMKAQSQEPTPTEDAKAPIAPAREIPVKYLGVWDELEKSAAPAKP